MSAMASQITVSIVHSTVYSAADQREHQSSASLAFKSHPEVRLDILAVEITQDDCRFAGFLLIRAGLILDFQALNFGFQVANLLALQLHNLPQCAFLSWELMCCLLTFFACLLTSLFFLRVLFSIIIYSLVSWASSMGHWCFFISICSWCSVALAWLDFIFRLVTSYSFIREQVHVLKVSITKWILKIRHLSFRGTVG